MLYRALRTDFEVAVTGRLSRWRIPSSQLNLLALRLLSPTRIQAIDLFPALVCLTVVGWPEVWLGGVPRCNPGAGGCSVLVIAAALRGFPPALLIAVG